MARGREKDIVTESHLSKQQRGRWSTRWVRFSTVVSIVAAVVLAGGFAYGTVAALGGSMGAAPLPTDANTVGRAQAPGGGSEDNTLHLVGLGDSLTHGVGDASGRGYVGDVSQQYRGQGYTVIQSNLGIDGLTSSGLVQEMSQASVRNLLQSADVILVSIGGNDLKDAAGLPNLDTKRISSAESQFNTNLTAIFSQIRQLNPRAAVALIGLYNPYGDDPSTSRQTDGIVQSWVSREEQVASTFPDTVVVQTFDLFHLHPTQFLYVDHFHPNQSGYQRIADRVWQDLQRS